MLKKNPHMLLEILDHSKMEQISIATDIYLIHLQYCQIAQACLHSFNVVGYYEVTSGADSDSSCCLKASREASC